MSQGAQLKFIQITDAQYEGLGSNIEAGAIYRTTDKHRLYIGATPYTKGCKVLSAAPTSATPGEADTLYFYDNTLYLCTGSTTVESTTTYNYVVVGGIGVGSVTSVGAGEGLVTDQTEGAPITATGSIAHAIPTGATVTSDPLSDQTPAFGGTFNIAGVATDKFGHVTAESTHTVTLPSETAVAVGQESGTAQTPNPGDTIYVVTGVAKGAGSHDVTVTTTDITLPDESDTTYTFATSTTTDGAITVTPSEGSSYDVVIKGFDDLAKKADITAIFKFKGTVATVAALPTTGAVGDVYHVTAASAEYVCIQASTTEPAADAVWEELGSEIDLSDYALSDDVIQRVTGVTGEVPKFKADGTVESTGFTLGTSVPSDAVFTDTTYSPVTADSTGAADPGLMTSADKYKLDNLQLYWEVYSAN